MVVDGLGKSFNPYFELFLTILYPGGDQGGSVRIPASYCGIVGLKPTHGLVPYTGAVPIVPCLDHLGPMTKNVADCALLLEVIAGMSLYVAVSSREVY